MHETNWFLGFLTLAVGLGVGSLLAWRFGRSSGSRNSTSSGASRTLPSGSASSGSATSGSATSGAATSGTATSGAASPGFASSGSPTSGTATSGPDSPGFPETSEPLAAQRAELEHQRDRLLAQLRELGPGDAEQKSALELQAAAVLRDLDRLEQGNLEQGSVGEPEDSAPGWRMAAWLGGTALVVLLLLSGLMQFTSERGPGGSITGNTSLPGAGTANSAANAPGLPADHPMAGRIAHLESLLAQDPQNLDLRLDLAQAYIYSEQGNLLVPAFEALQPVIEANPEHPRALTYVAIIRQVMGQHDMAFEALEVALKGDPSLTEAWIQRGLAAFRLGRWADAIESWEMAIEQREDGEQVLRPLVERAQHNLENNAPPPSPRGPGTDPTADPESYAQQDPHGSEPHGSDPQGSVPHARQNPSAPAYPQAHSAATGQVAEAGEPDPKAIRGRLELPESLAGEFGPNTLVFLFARPAGAQGGPPVAVKRLTVSQFPVDFSLGAADTMMGLPFPDSVDLEARIDLDGNAMTRDPSEPSAALKVVEAGTQGVVLKLTR